MQSRRKNIPILIMQKMKIFVERELNIKGIEAIGKTNGAEYSRLSLRHEKKIGKDSGRVEA